MYFERFFDKGLAQSSYLIGCQGSGEAIVVDPLRDVDRYLHAASREGLRITHVTETHVHADFVSGAFQLSQLSGARLSLSAEGGEDWEAQFPHKALRDGDEIRLGQVTIRALHTPGHTPEHLAFLVTDRAVGSDPVMVLTGDFLFVGDVGRPDLLESAAGVAGSAAESARRLFSSIRSIRELPDYVQVWPGHGAGSACGKAMGALPSTTIGYETRFNWALRERSESRFVESVLTGQPEVPAYFGRMKRINREGPTSFGFDALPPDLSPVEYGRLVDEGARTLDCRSPEDFAEGHIRGALNIPDDSSFSNWAGWLLEPDQRYVLVAPAHRIEELRRSLGRVGIDQVVGCFTDMSRWTESGGTLEAVHTVSAGQYRAADGGSGTSGDRREQVIDVRTTEEFEEGHIPGATHIHLGRLPGRIASVERDRDVLVYCQSGRRSSIATSLLLASGHRQVKNLEGGFSAWKAAREAGALSY